MNAVAPGREDYLSAVESAIARQQRWRFWPGAVLALLGCAVLAIVAAAAHTWDDAGVPVMFASLCVLPGCAMMRWGWAGGRNHAVFLALTVRPRELRRALVQYENLPGGTRAIVRIELHDGAWALIPVPNGREDAFVAWVEARRDRADIGPYR